MADLTFLRAGNTAALLIGQDEGSLRFGFLAAGHAIVAEAGHLFRPDEGRLACGFVEAGHATVSTAGLL